MEFTNTHTCGPDYSKPKNNYKVTYKIPIGDLIGSKKWWQFWKKGPAKIAEERLKELMSKYSEKIDIPDIFLPIEANTEFPWYYCNNPINAYPPTFVDVCVKYINGKTGISQWSGEKWTVLNQYGGCEVNNDIIECWQYPGIKEYATGAYTEKIQENG